MPGVKFVERPDLDKNSSILAENTSTTHHDTCYTVVHDRLDLSRKNRAESMHFRAVFVGDWADRHIAGAAYAAGMGVAERFGQIGKERGRKKASPHALGVNSPGWG